MEAKSKKIIILGTAHPFRGGLAAFNERLAIEFVKEGHHVIVYTFNLQYPGFLFPGKTQYSSNKAPDRLTIHKKINSVNPLNWVKVGKEIKKQNADIVIHCYWMSFFAPCFGTIARFSKGAKTKHFALIHNMIPHEPSILDRLFPKYFVRAMDGFVAMANSVKEDINRLDSGNKPVFVSPHPIYDHYGEPESKTEAAAKLGVPENQNYLLFFGLVRAYKGLDLLLTAFADPRLEKYNIKLVVAGEFYENEADYVKLIESLNIKERVLIHNTFIPDGEVRHYFSLCDMVVQPYKTATQSGVTQIAYHFNKPMLVSDVGGLSEIVPHNKVGYVVDVSPAAIADALVDFYENNRCGTFTSAVKTEKKKYLWSKMTSQFFKFNLE